MSKIAFIGCGNMAGCILSAVLRTRPDLDEIIISEPHPEKLTHLKSDRITIVSDNITAVKDAEVIFLGVKPQVLPGVLQELSGKADFTQKLIITMAAGFKCSSIEKQLKSSRIVRIMPNTPARLGLGVTGVYYYNGITEPDKAVSRALLKGLGLTCELESEHDINVVCAVAGSAPAFVYRFMEALIAESVKNGLPEAQSRQIIEQMVLGTVSMVIANQDCSIASLREAVTSKGGTTYAGLLQMTGHNFEQMMTDTVNASIERANEFERMY